MNVILIHPRKKDCAIHIDEIQKRGHTVSFFHPEDMEQALLNVQETGSRDVFYYLNFPMTDAQHFIHRASQLKVLSATNFYLWSDREMSQHEKMLLMSMGYLDFFVFPHSHLQMQEILAAINLENIKQAA